MASRLVLVVGDLFIPDRAPVCSFLVFLMDDHEANTVFE